MDNPINTPIINFLIQATTQGVDAARSDFTPFEDVCGYQMQHGFTLTNPKEEG